MVEINNNKGKQMYIIETTEKRPTLAVYEYIINADSEKEAISKFKNGEYEEVNHLKDLDILDNTEIEITTITKENK
jgi:hypothetical protein